MELKSSQTLLNLMRAFAGECQARTRYEFAAASAHKENLHWIERVFRYTAGQEYEHAEVFMNRIRTAGVDNIQITGGFPVDLQTDALSLLRTAHHNEFEEYRMIYPDFARVAQEEGFADIATLFDRVASIEQKHAERFDTLASRIESGNLFTNPQEVTWVCLNCGYVTTGTEAPQKCPVCAHEQGYYMRSEYAPYTK